MLTESSSILTALLLGDDDGWSLAAAAAFAQCGWQIRSRDDEDGCGAGGEQPILVLVHASHIASPGDADAWLRPSARWHRGTGIVIVTDDPSDLAGLPPFSYDDAVSCRPPADSVAKLVGRWRPFRMSEATRRVIDAFGPDAIHPMLDRFAATLDEALCALGRTGERSVAHRLAGIAGTLGFGELGKRWLALSEGDDGIDSLLRIDSRRAIRSIDAAF